MLTPEYVAGLFDGEGYVGVSYNPVRDTWKFTVNITNNYLPVLEEVKATYGGRLQPPRHADDGRAGKSAWTWHAYSSTAKNFLESIKPYSIVKQEQIQIALQYPLGRYGKRVTESVRNKRNKILAELKSAKMDMNFDARDIDLGSKEVLEKRDDVQEAAKLYQSGMEAIDIARKLDVELSTIYYWMRCLGINRSRVEAGKQAGRNRKDAVHNNPKAEEAKRLYQSGMSASDVARELGKKPATVNYWLRKMGVTRSYKEAQKLRRAKEK